MMTTIGSRIGRVVPSGVAQKLAVALPLAWIMGDYLVQQLLSRLATREECEALSTWLLSRRHLNGMICLLPFFSGGLAWACGRRDYSAIAAATCCAVGGYFGGRTFCSTLAYFPDTQKQLVMRERDLNRLNLTRFTDLWDLWLIDCTGSLQSLVKQVPALEDLTLFTDQLDGRWLSDLSRLFNEKNKLRNVELNLKGEEVFSRAGNQYTYSELSLDGRWIGCLPTRHLNVVVLTECTLDQLDQAGWDRLLTVFSLQTENCTYDGAEISLEKDSYGKLTITTSCVPLYLSEALVVVSSPSRAWRDSQRVQDQLQALTIIVTNPVSLEERARLVRVPFKTLYMPDEQHPLVTQWDMGLLTIRSKQFTVKMAQSLRQLHAHDSNLFTKMTIEGSVIEEQALQVLWKNWESVHLDLRFIRCEYAGELITVTREFDNSIVITNSQLTPQLVEAINFSRTNWYKFVTCTELELLKGLKTDIESLTFTRCQITQTVVKWIPSSVWFQECVLDGLDMSQAKIKSMTLVKCQLDNRTKFPSQLKDLIVEAHYERGEWAKMLELAQIGKDVKIWIRCQRGGGRRQYRRRKDDE